MEKIAFLHFGDRQTDRLTDRPNALRRSRCRERRRLDAGHHRHIKFAAKTELKSETHLNRVIIHYERT